MIELAEIKTSDSVVDPITLYISKYIIDGQPIPESIRRYRLRMTATVIVVMIACTSGIPYIEPSRKAFGDYEGLGWTCAAATILSFAIGSIWAWLNIIKELEPASPEEVEAINKKNKSILARLIFANVFGALATLVPTYAVYKFSSHIIYPIIAFAAGVATNIYALYQLYDSKEFFKKLVLLVKKIISRKQEMPLPREQLKSAVSNIPLFMVNTPQANRASTLTSLYSVHSSTAEIKKELFIKEATTLSRISTDNKSSELWLEGWPRTAVQAVSILFPITFSIVNGTLAYESSKLIVDHPLFAALYILVAVVPYMSIEFIAAIQTFGNIFDRIFNWATGNQTKSFSRKFHPNASTTLLCMSILLGIIPAASRVYITYNTLEGDGQYPLTVIAAIGGTIFQSYVLMDQMEKWIMGYSKRYGSEEQKELVVIQNKINKFNLFLAKNEEKKVDQFVGDITSREAREYLYESKEPNERSSILTEPSNASSHANLSLAS